MLLKASTKIEKTQSNAKGDVAPVSPTKHQQWIDTSDEQPILKEWDGTKWIAINFDIEKVDPITIGNIKDDIQSAVDDINSSKEQIQSALNKSQEAVDKAGLNDESIKEMRDEVDTAIQNSSNAISKSEQAIKDASTANDLAQQNKTNVEQVKNDVFDLENEMLTMGENIFPVPTFEGDAKLSSFSHTSDNDLKIFITDNDYKTGVKEPFVELNTPYKVKNDSDKILRIYGRATGESTTNRDLSQRKEFEFPIYSGQKFNISFDFRKTFSNGVATVGLMIYDAYSGGVLKKWVSKVFSDVDENWKRVNTVIEIPEGNYKFGKFYVSYQNAKSDQAYVDFDNIYITRADISQTLVEVSDGKIKTLISEQDKVNQRLETAEGSIQNIENLEGSNTLINTVNGMNQQIKNNQDEIVTINADVKGLHTTVENKAERSYVEQLAGQISQKVSSSDFESYKTQTASQIAEKVSNDTFSSYKQQTAGQIASIVSNQQNMWRDSSFEALQLSDYTTTSSTTKIYITGNNEKDTQSQKEQQYGKEFQINNNTPKALRFDGRTDNNSYLYSKDTYSVSVGEVIEIGFDFYKKGSGPICVGVRWFDKDGNLITGSNINSSVNSGGNWWHKNGKITVPEYFNIKQSDGSYVKKYPSKVQPYMTFNKTGASSDYCYVDNVKIIKQSSSQTFQSQTVDSLTEKVSTNEGKISEVTKKADGILTTITDETKGLEATYKKVEAATGTLTEIKNLEGSSTIVNTVTGLNTEIKNPDGSSKITQLANQISQKVSNSDFTSYKNQTAETISQAISSANGANDRLDTAEASIQQISKKSDDNTTLINQVKRTADENNQTINDPANGLLTQIKQNKTNINLIVSDSDTSYFKLSGNEIYAKTKTFVLDSNVRVGSGFTLTADKIKSKTLSGKNMSLDLDTGIYTTKDLSTGKQTILANGGIQSKQGTKLVNIGFGVDSSNTPGFGIQLKDNNAEQGVLAFDNDSFSVSTDYASGMPTTLGVGRGMINMQIGGFGNSAGLQLIKSGSTASLTNITQNTPTTVTWQDGQGGSISVGGNKSKMSANSSNYMIIGPRYQDTIIEGNKTISVHETFVDINFGNVTRRIKQSNLPDGTTTVFFGTTDGKGGFHFTGGRPYITMGGVTYAFDTKYLTKLTANYNTGE